MIVLLDQQANIKPGGIKDDTFVATSHRANVIQVKADFDSNKYKVNAVFKRADGFIIGPFELLPKIKNDGSIDYRELILENPILKVNGPLEITIRFEIFAFDQITEEFELIYSKPIPKIIATVQEAIDVGDSELGYVLNKTIDLQTQINELKDKPNVGVKISVEQPDPKKIYLWGKIL